MDLANARGKVALFTRAWIEIFAKLQIINFCIVALFTRAWIEMGMITNSRVIFNRRPLHEGVD